MTFSASLNGIMWRKALAEQYTRVRSDDFARVNLPIIIISVATDYSVLLGQVYIFRDSSPYDS